jgi:hypothetical protein
VRHDFVLDPNRALTIDLVDPAGTPLLESAGPGLAGLVSLIAPFARDAEPAVGASLHASGRALSLRSGIIGAGVPWRGMTIEASHEERVWIGVSLGDLVLASREAPIGVERVSLGVSLDALRGSSGSLALRVVDDWSSAPVPEASAVLTNALPVQATKWTDASGRATFEELVGGDVYVRVRAGNFVTFDRSVLVEPAKRSSLEARLEPAVTVSGVVRDEHGNPRTALQVRAIPANGDESRWLLERSTVTAQDGSFVLPGLSHREYTLSDPSTYVSKSSWPQYTRSSVPAGIGFVDARAGSVNGIELVIPLPKPQLSGATWHSVGRE